MQGWFSRIDRVPGLEVREAHNKGHHAILNWILEGGESGEDYGAEMIQENGDYYVRVNDPARVRKGVGRATLAPAGAQVHRRPGGRRGLLRPLRHPPPTPSGRPTWRSAAPS